MRLLSSLLATCLIGFASISSASTTVPELRSATLEERNLMAKLYNDWMLDSDKMPLPAIDIIAPSVLAEHVAIPVYVGSYFVTEYNVEGVRDDLIQVRQFNILCMRVGTCPISGRVATFKMVRENGKLYVKPASTELTERTHRVSAGRYFTMEPTWTIDQ